MKTRSDGDVWVTLARRCLLADAGRWGGPVKLLFLTGGAFMIVAGSKEPSEYAQLTGPRRDDLGRGCASSLL